MLASLLLIGVFLIAFSWFSFHSIWRTAAEIPCILIAGLASMNFFEPVAMLLTKSPSTAALLRSEADCACFLALFFSVLVLLAWVIAVFTDLPRLPNYFELVTRPLISVFASYLVMSIVLTGFDTSPRLQKLLNLRPDTAALFGIDAPDSHWLSFVSVIADGSLARPKSTQLSSLAGISPFESGTAGSRVQRLRERFSMKPADLDHGTNKR